MTGGLSGVNAQHQDMHFVARKRTVVEEEEEAGQVNQQMQDTRPQSSTLQFLPAIVAAQR